MKWKKQYPYGVGPLTWVGSRDNKPVAIIRRYYRSPKRNVRTLAPTIPEYRLEGVGTFTTLRAAKQAAER